MASLRTGYVRCDRRRGRRFAPGRAGDAIRLEGTPGLRRGQRSLPNLQFVDASGKAKRILVRNIDLSDNQVFGLQDLRREVRLRDENAIHINLRVARRSGVGEMVPFPGLDHRGRVEELIDLDAGTALPDREIQPLGMSIA